MVARLTLVALLFATSGCHETAEWNGEPWPKAWREPEHQFVIDRLIVPSSSAAAKALAFDLDQNGTLDNMAGNAVAGLGGYLDWSAQGAIDAQIARGDNLTLLTIYASSLEDSEHANLWTFLGEPQPLTDGPQPGDAFTVDRAASAADAWLGGSIHSREATLGGPNASLWLKLAYLGAQPFELQAARIKLWMWGDRELFVSGKLGGAIPATQLANVVLPTLAAAFDAEIVASCTLDPDRGCTCPSGSRVKTIQSNLDADRDCRVTSQEFQNNNVVKAFLKPDVTLPSGERGLSLGIGFTAVAASFDHAAPPAPGDGP